MDEIPVPNTFIMEDGTVIFMNYEADNKDADDEYLTLMYCFGIEYKYQTENIYEMMDQNIPRRELLTYLGAKYRLKVFWGYE